KELIHRCADLASGLKQKVEAAGVVVKADDPALSFQPADSLEALIKQGEEVGLALNPKAGEDIQSLQKTVLYGLKGIAAYTHHASVLGREDDAVYAFIHEALSSLYDCSPGFEGWIKMALRCGEVNLRAMELLDAANTGRYGHPVPTRVPLGHRKGKCILVSGHDLKDLEELLIQTEGLGISIYTHGEMLPAHGYPGLKNIRTFTAISGPPGRTRRRNFPNSPGPS
ncbi:MAG TPA: hydroxylamine reductase, partial [Bacillota bacterium]|nr:hydroxylamine reductase [Bacillota bacterium]